MGMDGDVIITLRMLMVGKEIGGIIGKGGANVEKFRQESGARINISSSHAGCNERIVTITGGRTQIHDACSLITEKVNEDVNSALSSKATSKIPVTIQLIIPASQCGSIIGKGGVKIKEIRDLTGCSIQVHSEMLPNSSERTVTLSGAPSTIIQCIDMLIDVMIQYPAKTATVPYNPQGNSAPILFHQGQTYMLQGNYPMSSSTDQQLTKTRLSSGMQKFSGSRDRGHRGFIFDDDDDSSPETSPRSSFTESKLSNNFPVRLLNASTQEVIVGNDIMGCIMGKGGSRINEIRSLSGAQIKIDHESKDEDGKEGEKPSERKITITGSAEEISLAQYLINLSVQRSSTDKAGGFSRRDKSLSDVFGNSTSILGQPPMFGASCFGGGMAPGAYGAALMSAKRSFLASSYRHRGGGYRSHRSKTSAEVDFTADVDIGGDSPNGKEKRKSKREKFQPY